MNTPICDFVTRYLQENAVRFHMPGHKGAGTPENRDITEISGADVLYHARGIIRESQSNAAALFGTEKTLYSTEGSSLAIRAMVYLTRLYAGRKPVIAAGRNAHKSFVTAAALLEAEVGWLYPDHREDLISCHICPDELDKFLTSRDVDAVYLTSPDYLGNVADIAAMAKVCHKHGKLLLVDNAHGAYLGFLQPNRHPIALGADLCCDSAHKTLPVLTGGAYLHIGNTAPKLFCEQAEKAMSLFASTSPSYLILQSLDNCNRYLSDGYQDKLLECIEKVSAFKEKLIAAGFALAGEEPLKLTLAPKSYGYTGTELADRLEQQHIICEFADPDYLTLMITLENTRQDLQKLEKALLSVPKAEPVSGQMPFMGKPEKGMSMHDAIMQPGQTLPVEQCVGRVLTCPTVSCPPAVPVLVCGERVSEEAVAVMQYYGIEQLEVI